jgi:acyl carrier protein phosphodiesterase
MDFLSLMIISEPNDKEKTVFFLNRCYRKQQNKKFYYREKFPLENARYSFFKDYFFSNPAVLRSLKRMRTTTTKFSEDILPVFYDYFLCRYWDRLFTISVHDYMISVNIRLSKSTRLFPYKGDKMLKKLVRQDWLVNYKSIEGIVKINKDFHKMNQHEYTNAIYEFQKNYDENLSDFLEYLKDFLKFIRDNKYLQLIDNDINTISENEKSVFIEVNHK